MKRYSQGVERPKIWIDYFTGTTTSAAGKLFLTLTHTPKSLNHVIVGYGHNAISDNRTCNPHALVGKVLELRVEKKLYYKTDTPTNADVGSTGAPANHTHGLQFTVTECLQDVAFMEAQPTITVAYEL